MLINIISSSEGGGAELLVRELHRIYAERGISSFAIYLTGNPTKLSVNEEVVGVNPRNPMNIFRIRKVLKSFLADFGECLTVHVHLTWPFFYVAFAALGLRGIKLVYTEHNTTNRRRRIPFFWIFERFVYSRYSRIICISDGVYHSLEQWVGPKLTARLSTIHNGSRIYTLVDRCSPKTTKPRLVSIGSLTTKKNFSTALCAIAQLKNEIECYTIIGEGSERSRLERIIRDQQLESVVKLLGWSDAIEEQLHAADIQVIPSLWEGFGLVAVEGMSTGLPVVASNVDGLRDVLGTQNPAVTLVNNPHKVDSWVHGLKQAIEKLREKGPRELGKASRVQAEKFTLEVMADRYIEVYRSL